MTAVKEDVSRDKNDEEYVEVENKVTASKTMHIFFVSIFFLLSALI